MNHLLDMKRRREQGFVLFASPNATCERQEGKGKWSTFSSQSLPEVLTLQSHQYAFPISIFLLIGPQTMGVLLELLARMDKQMELGMVITRRANGHDRSK